MAGRRRIRRKQLLDDLKEKIEYRKLKREALDRTLSRTRFGRGYGTDVWQTIELLLLLLLLPLLSPLCWVFTIIYLNQTMFLGYIWFSSCSVFTIRATCNVISSVKYVLCCYISTSHSMCAVPNMAIFCSSLISCFLGTLLRYCVNYSEMVPAAPVITGITFAFKFHMR